jgi:hypothetical protein
LFFGLTRNTGWVFLIALAQGKTKTFVSISEDDLIVLVDDYTVKTEVMANVHDAITNLSAGG